MAGRLSGEPTLGRLTRPQPFGPLHLDDRLSGNAKPAGFPVQGPDHPFQEVYIHPLDSLTGPTYAGKLEVLGDVLSIVEAFVEVIRLP
jgi:hypothetical protein